MNLKALASVRPPLLSLLAERTRFELVVPLAKYVGLANRWFQPLTHLSGRFKTDTVFRLPCKSIFSFRDTQISTDVFSSDWVENFIVMAESGEL